MVESAGRRRTRRCGGTSARRARPAPDTARSPESWPARPWSSREAGRRTRPGRLVRAGGAWPRRPATSCRNGVARAAGRSDRCVCRFRAPAARPHDRRRSYPRPRRRSGRDWHHQGWMIGSLQTLHYKPFTSSIVAVQLHHESGDPITAHGDALAVELAPDLLDAVHAEVAAVHASDVGLQPLIAQLPGRGPARDRGVVRGWGDLQGPADRLDPPEPAVSANEAHAFFRRRGLR